MWKEVGRVYFALYCSRCQKQYVGETKHTIITRLKQHLRNIIHKKQINTRLVQHFLQHGKDRVKITGIETNVFWSDRERKNKERYWIHTLNTRHPNGLNMKL